MIEIRESSEPNDITVAHYSNPVESTTSTSSHIRGVVTKSVSRMDLSEQYYRRTQTNCLPMNFQYSESLVLPSQATTMFSCDGLPRAKPEQQFTNTSATNIFSNNYNISTSMPVSKAPSQWTGPAHLLTDFDDQTSDYYGYSPQSNETTGGFHRNHNYADIPRTWPSQYEPRSGYTDSIVSKAYEPSRYMIDPNKESLQSTSVSDTGLSYDVGRESSQDFARLRISHSPKMEEDTFDSPLIPFEKPPIFVMPSRESSNDSGNSSLDIRVADVDNTGAEEPYAKLIYRALLSAPNHSMVLQEIYQWFRENTSKGSSDTKGWMNSIRHNLSMNAAFKKTERRLSGDEIKKSTEWVLEDFAIKDGVQSTTRYRKRTGNQKFIKSEPHTLAPLRQSSGRKGYISASKSIYSRHRVRDDHPDSRGPMQRLDTGRHPYQYQSRSRSTRNFSPMTPCPEIMSPASPFFLPKSEEVDVPYEDMYHLEDVQGVCTNDSPLFSNSQDCPFSPFHNPMHTSQLY